MDSKGGIRQENTTQWKNRAEAAIVLTIIPKKISSSVCQPYANEVLHYLEQCKYDRVCYILFNVLNCILKFSLD